MKKISTVILVLLLSFSVITTSFANSEKDTDLGIESSVGGIGTSEDTKLHNVRFNLRTIISDSYIKSAGCSIQDLRNGYAYITAYTDATTHVDSLQLNVYLQEWNGNYWVTVESWTKSAYLNNTITFNTSHQIISGEKYRVKTTHIIDHQGEIDSTETITSYIIAE